MMTTAPVSQYSQRQIIERTRHAADVARQLLDQIAVGIRPGMSESQARQWAKQVFAQNGIEKNWHNPYIYFGTNTLLTFMDKPTEDKILQESDIAYIDIGPIVDDVEGDVGCTLVFGDNPLFHALKEESERLFEAGRSYWSKTNATGIELYRYIRQETEAAGYRFNLDPAGHLIGSFPHKGWKEGLQTYPEPAEPGLWILEIQIRHPEQPYGAFYEAVLL